MSRNPTPRSVPAPASAPTAGATTHRQLVRVPGALLASVLLFVLAAVPPAAAVASQSAAPPADTWVSESAASNKSVSPAPIGKADYDRLLQWRFATTAQPLPDGGVTFSRGPATWTLQSGTIRLQEPIGDPASGAVTGAVFEGTGQFRLDVDDPVEREQVQRFTQLTPDGAYEATFHRMVLRLPGGAAELLGVPPAGEQASYAKNDLAADREEHWLEHLGFDVDARVIIALLTPGSEYLASELESEDDGWLFFDLDPRRREAAQLRHWEKGALESWLSLELSGEQARAARAGAAGTDPLVIHRVDIRADLTEPGRGPARGRTETRPRIGQFTADLDCNARVSGPQVLALQLRGDAEVKAVRVDGEETLFLRNHIGGRKFGIHDKVYDDDLAVLLPGPLIEGQKLALSVDYQMEIYNYLGGRGWYPDDYGRDILERHTGTIDLTMPDKLDARAMGKKVEETDEGRVRHQRWVIDKPTFMLTFSWADRPYSYELDVKGAPPIEVFGPGMDSEAKFHNVAADTANSIRFFTELFKMPLETDHMEVASIAAGHGQSFDGFIHMSEGTFYLERPGASELFRAHEVAHQWWGHRVSWATYRDQWLSEAFAEYSAMMYVQTTMEDGEHWFGEILDTYNDELNGSIQSFLSKFARPGLTPLNPNERAKMGPIGLGYRAYSELTPGAYFAQTYQKGALVLHMLRVMLRNLTKSDDLFVKVLSDFLHEYDGKAASTQDFINVLSQDAPGHWKWFFDQWVYGTAIPTYKWDWKTVKGGDAKHPYVLHLTVRQEGVPDGFRMPVPIRIDFGRAGSGQAVVLVDKPEETFQLPLPAQPKDVELNPRHAVLANMGKL